MQKSYTNFGLVVALISVVPIFIKDSYSFDTMVGFCYKLGTLFSSISSYKPVSDFAEKL